MKPVAVNQYIEYMNAHSTTNKVNKIDSLSAFFGYRTLQCDSLVCFYRMMDISDMQKLVYFERLLLSWKIIIFSLCRTASVRKARTASHVANAHEQCFR
jgi:hypothetical protein